MWVAFIMNTLAEPRDFSDRLNKWEATAGDIFLVTGPVNKKHFVSIKSTD